MTFTEEEIASVVARHPDLMRIGPGTVEGSLDLHAVYEGEEIRDQFQVRIARKGSSRVPALFEIGGRTDKIAAKWATRDSRALHRNADGTACVCVKQEEQKKFPPEADLLHFIDHLVRDYLYGLAFFDRYGRWPWGERSHGTLGILEYYADSGEAPTREEIDQILPLLAAETNWRGYYSHLRRPSGERACLCGSRVQFRKCHPVAWQGLVRLGEEMDRLGMSRRGALDRARMGT